MQRPPIYTAVAVFAGVSVGGMVVGTVGGSNLGVLYVSRAVAVAAAALALVAWQSSRAVAATAAGPYRRWWWLVLAGGAVLVTVIVATTISGALSDEWWAPVMLISLSAVVTLASGLVLGVARLASRHTAPT